MKREGLIFPFISYRSDNVHGSPHPGSPDGWTFSGRKMEPTQGWQCISSTSREGSGPGDLQCSGTDCLGPSSSRVVTMQAWPQLIFGQNTWH